MQVTDAMVAKAADALIATEYGRHAKLSNLPKETQDLYLTDARAALTAALAEMWQDMDSAPKDGERVLLGFRDSMSAEGYWHDGSRNHWKREGWYFADDDVLTGRPCDPDCYMHLPVPRPSPGAADE